MKQVERVYFGDNKEIAMNTGTAVMTIDKFNKMMSAEKSDNLLQAALRQLSKSEKLEKLIQEPEDCMAWGVLPWTSD